MGIFEDVKWDIEPRLKETKMDTRVAKLFDDEWLDFKERGGLKNGSRTFGGVGEKTARQIRQIRKVNKFIVSQEGSRRPIYCEWNVHHVIRSP